MNTIIYLGMDVHTTNYTLSCYIPEEDKIAYVQQVQPDYRFILAYMEQVRLQFDRKVEFVCGYEAGCLGYSLYHQLTAHHVNCIILAPTTMLVSKGQRKIKTDKRDSAIIAQCLAFHSYRPVYVPTHEDEQVKEFIRMRDDHKLALKKIKQQISALCLRYGQIYTKGSNKWTTAHLRWLKALKFERLCQEVLDEYLATYFYLNDKIERLDRRIEELASQERYQGSVSHLTCLLGVKTHTALSVIVEVGDFNRFSSASQFACFLGLVPGEDSSSDRQKRLGITKAGNTHVRRLLVESAQGYGRGKAGHKSKELKSRQAGSPPEIIAFADKGNERLRRRFHKMVMRGKAHNVVKTAIARELACFMWGMMTGNVG